MTAITARQRWQQAYLEERHWPTARSGDDVLRRALVRFFGSMFPPVFPRTFAALPVSAATEVDWSDYFDHCWIAKNAASLSASYNDLVGSQTLTVGGAPTFGANGWTFNGSDQYLVTGLYPCETWTMMIRIANGGSGPKTCMGTVGWESYQTRIFSFYPNWSSNVIALNGLGSDSLYSGVGVTDGVICLAGKSLYIDGSYIGDVPGTTTYCLDNLGNGITIGANGRISDVIEFWPGDVIAAGIKAGTLSGSDVALASAAMVAL